MRCNLYPKCFFLWHLQFNNKGKIVKTLLSNEFLRGCSAKLLYFYCGNPVQTDSQKLLNIKAKKKNLFRLDFYICIR